MSTKQLASAVGLNRTCCIAYTLWGERVIKHLSMEAWYCVKTGVSAERKCLACNVQQKSEVEIPATFSLFRLIK